VRDVDRVAQVGTAVAVRMIGADSPEALGEFGRDEVARQARKRVAIIVTPSHVASWDHAKLYAG